MDIKNISKNLIHIYLYTPQSERAKTLGKAFSTDKIKVVKSKNNTHIIINENFYRTNFEDCALKINDYIQKNISNVVALSSFDLIDCLSFSIDNANSPINLYFTSNCKVDFNKLFTFENIRNVNSIIFDNNISIENANKLLKMEIPFITTKNYKLLNLNRFSGSNQMYSLSDYYNLTKLVIGDDLIDFDLYALDKLFKFNRCLYEMELNCNLKTAHQIVTSYLNSISKYSFCSFTLKLDNIVLNPEENVYLYEINRLLTKNKCKLNLTIGNETISYTDYNKTLTPLKKFANKINGLNLSTWEKLILIDDFTKAKPYNDSENKSVSRNLFSSLNSDYIVCFTYSNTFKVLCNMCHIPATIAKCRVTYSSGKSSEHSKVICSVKDSKYNKNGIYIFDPSNDSIDTNSIFDEEQPSDNYLFFANTINQNKLNLTSFVEEFGLLKLAEIKKFSNLSIEQINEACTQINELFGTKFSAYNGDNLDISFNITLNSIINQINNTTPVTIDEFKEFLTFAKSSIGEFTDTDLERIITINSFKSISHLLYNDENIFAKCATSLLDTGADEQIISFDDFE